jgi:zinc and cadmium transporter
MAVLPTILLFTFLASIVSLVLVGILLLHKQLIHKVSFYMVSFAAGSLLATAFTDTMPEAVDGSSNAYIYMTLFIGLFFLIERVFLHIHHHDEGNHKMKLPIPFLIFGDALHNFIDGVSIASTFLVSFPVGIVTTIAVFIHEIPHELGDFGILLHVGYTRKKVLIINMFTGIAAIAGALIGYMLGSAIHGLLPILLALTTGNFLYLSLSDLLPEIHVDVKGKEAFYHVSSFFLGILFIIILGQAFKEH